MIEFDRVTYRYPDARRPALHNLSLTLPPGEFTLVAGPTGAGKSTLLRCINGLVPHFTGGTLEGSVRVNGLDPVEATPQRMSRHVGFVFQDPEAQFVMDRVEDELAFALENAAMPPQTMRIRVEETLDLLDLAALRARPLLTLSGGEKQRVAIAAALALRPSILVLDEPTSQLDPKSAEDVLSALARLNADLGLTIVMAEHRLERILPFVDQMVWLPDLPKEHSQGDGNAAPVDAPQSDKSLLDDPRTVLQAMPQTPPLIEIAKALHWSPLPLTIKEGLRHSRNLSLPALPVDAEQSTVQGRESTPAVEPLLSAKSITVSYDSQPALQQVDFAVYPSEIVAVMGRNGSGKTTLLKTLVGLIRPKQGRVLLEGKNTAALEVADISRTVGYLPQDPNTLLFADTVHDEVMTTLRNHGYDPARDPASLPIQPDQLLRDLGLADLATAYPRDLSVGQRQRVALAAITITQPRVLLLDEPTRGLDYVAKSTLIDLLQHWRAPTATTSTGGNRAGMGIVIVTHDVELVAALAQRVVLMSQGEIIAQGDPATVLGASPLFAPQTARLFPNRGWLTPADVPLDQLSTS